MLDQCIHIRCVAVLVKVDAVVDHFDLVRVDAAETAQHIVARLCDTAMMASASMMPLFSIHVLR
jgi:hypothetical protein